MDEEKERDTGDVGTKPLQNPKNPLLLEKLKDIYVVSSSPASKTLATEGPKERALPSHRHIVEDPESGFLEPTEIPEGKITLSQVLHLLTKYDPNIQSISEISQKYKLDEELTQNIFKHFATFQVHVPQTKSASNGPDIPKLFVPKKTGEKPPEIET